ncbi:MAG: ATP-binding response regulator, partial [Chloroflexota bacterium]
HQSGQHLLMLINDILDLAKVEAGKMELHRETFAVTEVVEQVVGTIQPLADRAEVRLIQEPLLVGEIVADQSKLKQILYNLLSNAIKFTPAKGTVTIAARRLSDAFELTVADTGVGIAATDQERIFQEFQQLDAGPGRQHGGTGLGLALTRRFVELHGGRLWLESAPGQGSTFHVTLPIRQGLAVDQPPGLPGPLVVATARSDDRPLILVVEDETSAATLLTLYLGRGGYRTEVVTDGREVVERARALRPVAITLDVMLPSLDGWEVLRALKIDEIARDIPVAVVSVVSNQELGYALGAVDYFLKPVDRQALLNRLARYTFTTKVRSQTVRILVVDDDPDAVKLLAGSLTPAGFTVLKANGGAEGIDLAHQATPDLILLDLMMPGMSGFDVIAALKSDPTTRSIPILVVTAKLLTEEDKRALNGDVAAILRKGTFGAVELVSWLDDILERLGVAKMSQSIER